MGIFVECTDWYFFVLLCFSTLSWKIYRICLIIRLVLGNQAPILVKEAIFLKVKVIKGVNIFTSVGIEFCFILRSFSTKAWMSFEIYSIVDSDSIKTRNFSS